MNSVMNVNNENKNISFNSRYLRIINPEKFPKELLTSIKSNKAFDEFLREGRPKTFFEKLKDLFKKDEYVNVSYNKSTSSSTDPYYSEEQLSIHLTDKNFKAQHIFDISAVQQGIRRQQGSIPKPGENFRFKPPFITAAERIQKAFESITDFKEQIIGKSPSQHLKV